MSKKIFQSIFCVSLIVTTVALILFSGIFNSYISSVAETQLKYEAGIIVQGLNEYGTDFFSMTEENSTIKSRITVIDEYGNAIYDSTGRTENDERYYLSEEIMEALAYGEGFSSRKTSFFSETKRYYAVPVMDYCILRLTSNHFSVPGLLVDNLAIIVFLMALLILLSLLLARDKSKNITRPINDIDLHDPVIPDDYNEISPLINKINEQNEKIQEQFRELKHQREEFRIITENMNEGIMIVDVSYEVLSINNKALYFLEMNDRYSDSDGFNLNDIPAPDEFMNTLKKSLQGASSEITINKHDVFYEIFANPISDDEGMVVGSAVMIMDATQKHINEKLMREFTSNASHELKTPLTHIFGFSDMLLQGMIPDEKIYPSIQIIRDEAVRMMELVEKILKLSRIDENRMSEEWSLVDIFDMANHIIINMTRSIEEKGITVNLHGEHVIINGVNTLLSEIIRNVIENAIKHNVDDGKIDVEIHRDGEYARIIVSDTGIGIPESETDRIFERFYRIDKSHSQGIPGNGLGLAIAKDAASFHNGTITVASTPGEGTAITVRLPVNSR